MTRCQICGRRKGLRRDGMIGHHHLAGAPCPGIGCLPIEQADDRLESYLAVVEAREREISAELLELYDRRANYIPPELTDRLYRVGKLARRIRGRLDRHRRWPERFRRQMEVHGWGSPPPAYLLEREAALAAGKFDISE